MRAAIGKANKGAAMNHRITDPKLIGAILAYCREKRQPAWVVHIRPDLAHLPFPGGSCELLDITPSGMARIRWANGDQEIVDISELHMRAAY